MAIAKLGNNTVIRIGTQKITGFKSVSNVGGSRAVQDSSDMDSTWKEKIVGMPDAGSVTLTFNEDQTDTGQKAIYTAFTSGALSAFDIQKKDATGYAFSGYVTNVSVNVALEATNELSVTVEISGPVTYDQTPAV